MTQHGNPRTPSRRIHQELGAFLGVGIVAAIAHYGTLIVLVEVFGLGAVTASTIGFACGAIVSYTLNYKFTFLSNNRHCEAFIKFVAVAVVGSFLNGVILAFMMQFFRLHYLAAQVIATGLVFVWSYLANRMWTFKRA